MKALTIAEAESRARTEGVSYGVWVAMHSARRAPAIVRPASRQKQCVICGNTFSPPHHRTTVCSLECEEEREALWNERKNRHKREVARQVRNRRLSHAG